MSSGALVSVMHRRHCGRAESVHHHSLEDASPSYQLVTPLLPCPAGRLRTSTGMCARSGGGVVRERGESTPAPSPCPAGRPRHNLDMYKVWKGGMQARRGRAHLYFLPVLEGDPGWHIAQRLAQAFPARRQPQLQQHNMLLERLQACLTGMLCSVDRMQPLSCFNSCSCSKMRHQCLRLLIRKQTCTGQSGASEVDSSCRHSRQHVKCSVPALMSPCLRRAVHLSLARYMRDDRRVSRP